MASLSICIVACDKTAPASSAAQEAFDELQQKYDELVEERLEDPVQWAADDIENIGDWEYRALEIQFESPDDLAAQLNELGNEKWEVIWMERSSGGFLVIAKKPSISYLSRIPLSEVGRFVIPDGQ